MDQIQTATMLDAAARRVMSKLNGTTFSKLDALWATWEPEMLGEFNAALAVWHEGTGYMHTDEDDLDEKTPLDGFAEKYPEDWKDYADIVAAGAEKRPLYRVLLYHQAYRIVDRLAYSGQMGLLEDLWYELDHQNQLNFSGNYVNNGSLKPFQTNVKVRRFSSWTAKASVAYKLSMQGGEEQIGDGAVIVRTTANPRVVHTFDAATAFERWCAANKDKVPNIKPFMARWTWQLEYVVEASNAAERDVVQCDAVVVVSDDQSEYYRVIREAAGYGDDE